VICTIGAYTVHNNTFNVVMMLVFGVAGYLLKKCNYPLGRWSWPSCLATGPRTPSGSLC
jgi:TctA family transporter